jgi:hypothetical protein
MLLKRGTGDDGMLVIQVAQFLGWKEDMILSFVLARSLFILPLSTGQTWSALVFLICPVLLSCPAYVVPKAFHTWYASLPYPPFYHPYDDVG